jgi:hypothetical protein
MVYAQKNPIAYKEKPADSAKMNEEFTQVYSILNDLEDRKADLASPALTGTPTAPTPTVGDNSTKVATTAFVNTEISNDRPYATASPLMDGTAAVGVSAKVAREDHKHPTDTSRAASSHSHDVSDVTDLQTTLDGKVPTGRTVTAGNGLTGGGDLSANRTLTLGTPASCSPATSNAVTAESHTHAITGVAASSHTHSDYVPTGRTVTAGNGLSGGGALSGNITVTMGTPGSCSTSTSNAVTATSHTHAITGVAASSHTHSYVPIPTSSSLPVGMIAFLLNYNGGDVANGGTLSGGYMRIVKVAVLGPAFGHGGTPPGTWKNITGQTLEKQTAGFWVRIA